MLAHVKSNGHIDACRCSHCRDLLPNWEQTTRQIAPGCPHPSLLTVFQSTPQGLRVSCGACDTYLYHMVDGKMRKLPNP